MGDTSETRAATVVYYSGTVKATVVQLCVRTTAQFSVPITRAFAGGLVLKRSAGREEWTEEERDERARKSEKEKENAVAAKERRGRKGKKRAGGTVAIDEVEKLVAAALASETAEKTEDLYEATLTDAAPPTFELVENDPTIILGPELVDLGELAVQEIVANLDPYPTAPGSVKVVYSTGWT